jgi:cyclophilin family peptidyl-prolyl cis-trans isomerase
MHRRTLIAALAALALATALLAGCSGTSSSGAAPATPTSPSADSSPSPSATTAVVVVRLTTSKGIVDLELYPTKAPVTVANFLKLVNAKFYDGILVHRVEPGFVVQAGDPQTRGLTAKFLLAVLARQQSGTSLPTDPQIGAGGPGWTIPLENSGLLHDRGVIAMARTSDPNSAGSQFYITLAAAHELDEQYAVFGRVTAGMDVVDRLAIGDVIRSARVIAQ